MPKDYFGCIFYCFPDRKIVLDIHEDGRIVVTRQHDQPLPPGSVTLYPEELDRVNAIYKAWKEGLLGKPL